MRTSFLQIVLAFLKKLVYTVFVPAEFLVLTRFPTPAGVMELVDVVDSKSTDGDIVPVRVRPPAPKHSNPNLLPIGETFGFVVFLNVHT